MKLRITSRYDDVDDLNVAALWIGGQNIWDIGNQHVCPDVLNAIRNAYDIGKKHGIEEMLAVRPNLLGFDAKWEDERKGVVK